MTDLNLNDLRVLIVDDFEMGRFLLRKALNDLGCYSTDEAEDGVVAIERIKSAHAAGAPYSIVFCDWTMPEASGMDVLNMMRSTPAFAKTPFIMVTATSDRESVVRALDAGASEYISKPISPELLAMKVERILGVIKNAST